MEKQKENQWHKMKNLSQFRGKLKGFQFCAESSNTGRQMGSMRELLSWARMTTQSVTKLHPHFSLGIQVRFSSRSLKAQLFQFTTCSQDCIHCSAKMAGKDRVTAVLLWIWQFQRKSRQLSNLENCVSENPCLKSFRSFPHPFSCTTSKLAFQNLIFSLKLVCPSSRSPE